MKKFLYSVLVCVGLATSVSAQISTFLSDSARISLLTCSPGGSVEELFGHTAIRIEDPATNLDLIVNYGLFSFDQPNFVGRFVAGETDYMVGANYPSRFIRQYAYRGSSVTQQTLALTATQRNQLYNALLINMMPENATYRYNFIFNNCATKPRDLIAQSLGNSLQYPFGDLYAESDLTFREAIKRYTRTAAWSQFGFDLCLGVGTDRLATNNELMFLPELLQEAYSDAKITTDEGNLPLVSSTTVLTPKTRTDSNYLITPNRLFWILFVIILSISMLGYRKLRPLKGLDAFLFTVGGLVGCLITYLMFFSEHPFTDSNFNLWVLNPLMFWPLISLCIKPLRRFDGYFYSFWAISSIAFIIAIPIMSQAINLAMIPLVGCFCIRSACRAAIWLKTKA
ncbi:MAG: DUF4105 domain-containing protein [Paludibacteraceae bacterium]|nr:DUF4105 domain-containing protein [Paludibacteraceae bacterium]